MVKRFIEDEKSRKLTYKNRVVCIKKKAMELATLCGIRTCAICLGHDGEIDTWPENPSEVIYTYKRNYDQDLCASEPKTTELDTEALAEKIERVEKEIDAKKRENLLKVSMLMQSELDFLNARVEYLKAAKEHCVDEAEKRRVGVNESVVLETGSSSSMVSSVDSQQRYWLV